jgi:hypothetical protein
MIRPRHLNWPTRTDVGHYTSTLQLLARNVIRLINMRRFHRDKKRFYQNARIKLVHQPEIVFLFQVPYNLSDYTDLSHENL